MKPLNLHHITARTVALIIVGFAMIMLPGVDFAGTLAAFVCLWISIEYTLSKTEWKSETAWYALLAASVLTSIGIVANVHGYTVEHGLDTSSPYLFNTDYNRYFYTAKSIVTGEQAENYGYSLFIAAVWKITGISIVPPLIINQAAILFSIIVCGEITHRVIKNAPSAPTVAVILLSAICYFLNHATLLLKEGLITLFLSLFILLLLRKKKNYPAIAAILLLFGLIRYHWLAFPAVAAIVMMIDFKSLKKNVGLLYVLLIVGFIFASYHIFFHSRVMNFISEAENISGSYVTFDSNRAEFWTIIGDYFSFPFLKKVLLLPLSALVQIITPLPWNFERDMVYGFTQWYSHLSYPWYAISGIVAYFYLFAFRKCHDDLLKRLALAGLLLWLVPAYIFAGSVSRYSLCFLPMIVPGAAYVISKGCYRNRSFIISFAIYVTGVAGGLITIYAITA